MPKICQHEHCSNPVFGGGYCRNHQYYRSDKPRPVPKIQTAKIKAVSKKQQQRNATYSSLRIAYLKDHPLCVARLVGCTGVGTDIHHMQGRIGDKLLDTSTWCTLCRNCHQIVEENPKMAKELNLSQSRLKE